MSTTISHSFHYRKKATGWQVILSYKSGGKWKQKTKQGFSQKNLAKAAGEKLLKELEENYSPTPIDPSLQNITLKQFWPIFYEDKKITLSTKTIIGYEQALQTFSKIVNIPIRELKKSDVQSVVNEWTGHPRTIKDYLGKLKTMMKHAISFYQLLQKSPFDGILLPIIKDDDSIKTITEEEFNKLHTFLYENHYMYAVMVSIGYYAGLRYGEIAGLTWDNIDLKAGELSIKQQFKLYRDDNNKVTYKLGPLKTRNSRRCVPIPRVLQHELITYKAAGIPEADDGRIFPLTGGGSVYINNRIKQILPNASVHMLRHTYATTLLSKGIDIKTVAALLGDTVETVISKYIHYTEQMRKNAAKNIQKIFD